VILKKGIRITIRKHIFDHDTIITQYILRGTLEVEGRSFTLGRNDGNTEIKRFHTMF
jgi:hypothetical protein